jgi:hypothetical protein
VHRIEPFYLWRDLYRSEEDPNAINFGREYSELYFTERIYNYLIHPQWDSFGSETLFYKQIYADYDKGFAIIELLGEWNDCIGNDVMFLKNELIEPLIDAGIQNFMIIMENVLNFHGQYSDYYEEWADDIEGEIYMINLLPHVMDEFNDLRLNQCLLYDGVYNDVNWRVLKPEKILSFLKTSMQEEEF